jgi:hypothetical protein
MLGRECGADETESGDKPENTDERNHVIAEGPKPRVEKGQQSKEKAGNKIFQRHGRFSTMTHWGHNPKKGEVRL